MCQLFRYVCNGYQCISNCRFDEITTLASYRPESAAFTFSFNRPKTGRRRQESEDGSAVGGRRAPSAFRSRANHSSAGMNNVRAVSSTRANTFIPEDTVEFIPDLDDVREEDLQGTVASAPAYEIQRMASLKELDEELMQSKPFSVVDGVNLRKLCKFIVPEKQLMEHDELWTWDSLYTEIISSPELGDLIRISKKDAGDPDVDAITSKVPQ
ncbi:Intraflagellar transport protein 43 B [Orchesella cincta]|uniref:Intraflagellar transport protein 43 B n=1 Tax=Orchesella cincta TaxID=48709 RepID=A0A1D2MB84_ORCCI|nr:Intraflagellar transport protein 43 B [Orchesella cincta]